MIFLTILISGVVFTILVILAYDLSTMLGASSDVVNWPQSRVSTSTGLHGYDRVIEAWIWTFLHEAGKDIRCHSFRDPVGFVWPLELILKLDNLVLVLYFIHARCHRVLHPRNAFAGSGHEFAVQRRDLSAIR